MSRAVQEARGGNPKLSAHPAGTPTLEVRGVTKSYVSGGFMGRLFRRRGSPPMDALCDVSFEVHPGEMIGLLGPNGAGKTTLLKIIGSMVFPTSGSVRVCGESMAQGASAFRRRIGVVASDERSFYWRLTGRQNLEFFAALYDVPRRIAPGRIAELLENLGLTSAADRPFSDYSSGMKQKMAIARGLMGNPSLVLYDEPTRALDPLSTRNIRQWLKENQLRSPCMAHVIATNQMDEAEQMCDRLIILNRGRIVSAGTVQEIRRRFQRHSVHRLVCRGLAHPGSIQPDRETGILSVTSRSVEQECELRIETVLGGPGLTSALQAVIAQGADVVSCVTEEMPLQDVICSIVLEDRQSNEPLEVRQ